MDNTDHTPLNFLPQFLNEIRNAGRFLYDFKLEIATTTEEWLEYYRLALKIAETVKTEEGLDDLEAAADSDLYHWVNAVASNLLEHNLIEEALNLHVVWSRILLEEDFLGTRAEILAQEGRDEEALEQMAALEKEYPGNGCVQTHYAVVLEELGRDEEAEQRYRNALEISDDFEDLQFAADQFAEFLDDQGREEEAEALREKYELDEEEEEQ